MTIAQFIPHLERMIDKERNHYEWLQKVYEKHSTPKILNYMLSSSKMLSHYEKRLEEYKEFAEKEERK